MKRRDFIRLSGKIAALSPILINGLPMRALSQSNYLTKALNGTFDDKKLILIQLHGGNDGLNSLIPINQYGTYATYRPNLAISDTGARKYIDLDSTLAANAQAGLHPDMSNFKNMYDQGLINIVQGVGYENTNGSHFRSRDIWYMGGSYNEYKNSGWMGRYLDHEFPNYPDAYPNSEMPDPLGLEIGSKVSLGYHRAQGIPTAIALQDASNISSVLSTLGGINPTNLGNDHYSQELQNIIDIYGNTNDFAQNIQDRYEAGSNNVNYPGGTNMQYPYPADAGFIQNQLGPQLQTVARLIHGGSKTKIYLVRLNGFDTHNDQVTANETSYGNHGALMYHLSNAVKAFFDDLAISGKDEEVLAMTFTDFGRRPESNGSQGTDHGTASPTFVFGKGVIPGVIGENPSMTNLDSTGNLLIQNDYRQVITSVLCDWLGADMDALVATEMDAFANQKLAIIDTSVGIKDVDKEGDLAINIFPNPVADFLNMELLSKVTGQAEVAIYDVQGKKKYHTQIAVMEGSNLHRLSVDGLESGHYTLAATILNQRLGQTMQVGKKFLKQ